ncbi:MAG: FAD-binding oxidoreductase [Gemmatimonadota bacterium]|nr:FAD-binding oxidoreductase [Gemmatimonadota bacterium]
MIAAQPLSDLLPPEALASVDSSPLFGGRPPEAIVRPASVEEVAALLSWASREGVGVLTMASGHRVAPVTREGRFVALRMDRLNAIEAYEAADLTITAGAGAPFSSVTRALGENDQWAPFDPADVAARSLGGLVAAGESGPLRMGYGELRNHVLGARVVTGDGRTLDLGGRVVKNVAGFDVLKAVVGSRGGLAAITSVCLRAFPRPEVDRVLVRTEPTVRAAAGLALAVGTAPVLPASCVVVDRLSERGERAALVVRLHGSRATVDEEQVRMERHVGVPFEVVGDVGTGADAASSESTRRLLEGVRDHVKSDGTVVVASVRPSRLPRLLEVVDRLGPLALSCDAYTGLVRVEADPERITELDLLRRDVIALDGAIRQERISSTAMRGSADPLSPHDDRRDASAAGRTALARRLETAFDPAGALWPART